jgi:hypothetical protein
MAPPGPHAGEPTKPVRFHVRWKPVAEGFAFTFAKRELFGGCFMLVWLSIWTVGCVFLAGLVIHEPKLMHFCFAVPFWAAWFFVTGMMVNSLFGREEFTLDRDGATYVRRAIVTLASRHVPPEEIEGFGPCSVKSGGEGCSPSRGIEMRTLGTPLRFAVGLPEDERRWIEFHLNEYLAETRGIPMPAVEPDEERDELPCDDDAPSDDLAGVALAVPVAHGEPGAAEVLGALEPAESPRKPPSDTRWRRLEGFDAVEFVERGRLGCGVLLGLLFVNGFWNGIVSVFVVALFSGEMGAPQGIEWWGMFVFLIPFEAIGLVMLLVLLVFLAEPFRRTVWRFHWDAIECRMTWFGLGPRWIYDVFSRSRL